MNIGDQNYIQYSKLGLASYQYFHVSAKNALPYVP